jgi:hypothetical protein
MMKTATSLYLNQLLSFPTKRIFSSTLKPYVSHMYQNSGRKKKYSEILRCKGYVMSGFYFLGAFPNSENRLLAVSCLSVCLSVCLPARMKQLGSHWMDFQ